MTEQSQKYTSALIVLTSLFFMWGFITVLNDILIPFLKKMFELNRYQSMYIKKDKYESERDSTWHRYRRYQY